MNFVDKHFKVVDEDSKPKEEKVKPVVDVVSLMCKRYGLVKCGLCNFWMFPDDTEGHKRFHMRERKSVRWRRSGKNGFVEFISRNEDVVLASRLLNEGSFREGQYKFWLSDKYIFRKFIRE